MKRIVFAALLLTACPKKSPDSAAVEPTVEAATEAAEAVEAVPEAVEALPEAGSTEAEPTEAENPKDATPE